MADIRKLVEQMSLEEKASLLGGESFWLTKPVERLGIPKIMVSDGPHGLRKQEEGADHLGINDSIKAVCWPAACATAASFDRELIGKMGEAIGLECQAEGVSIVLGPAVNIKRSPLCGRNFEYMSEDPYLAGEMAAAFISGVQSKNVGTSIKHFAANNQEYYRMSNNSVVSERSLREIYFPAFEIAVKKAQPWTVMCSYNKINGVYASDNEWLLEHILREEWGFQGFVMTDWGAVDDRVMGVRAGLDLEMPGPTGDNDRKIVEAVREGRLEEARVDRAVENILRVIFEYLENRIEDAVFDREKDHLQAIETEAECAVLLENNGVLPLQRQDKIVYIGEFAAKPRFQGGGSSHINASKTISALEAAENKGFAVPYIKGFPFDQDETDEEEIQKAVEAARKADAAVIFAGLPDSFESEGYDRPNMKLPACQDRLIREVAAVQKNTVVVLHNGSPVEAPWAGEVAAVLEMYLGGQGVGEATDQLLYGEKNPCGHLAETFPLRLEDNPSYLNFNTDPASCIYAEGVYVGYRYYEAKKIPVRWAFGRGLSYTSFKIHNLRLSSQAMKEGEELEVQVDITNTGDRFGKEVVQLYIGDHSGSYDRPLKELKGFEKVALMPGETKTVTMKVDTRALSYFDETMGEWFAQSGEYEILVGNASDQISQRAVFSYHSARVKPIHIDEAATVGELLAHPSTGPIMEKLLSQMSENSPIKMDEEDPMMMAILRFMPLKTLKSFGMMKEEEVEGLKKLLQSAANEKRS